MGGLAVGIYAKLLAAILCLIAAIWLLLWYFIPAPPSVITIASGVKNGVFEHIARDSLPPTLRWMFVPPMA
jgi:hypothetical protein